MIKNMFEQIDRQKTWIQKQKTNDNKQQTTRIWNMEIGFDNKQGLEGNDVVIV